MKKAAAVLVFAVIAGLTLFFCLGEGLAPFLSELAGRAEKKPFAAAVGILGAYGAVSVVFFIPVSLLAFLSGAVFPPPVALGVNLAGTVLCLSLPYWFGRQKGSSAVAALSGRFAPAEKLSRRAWQRPALTAWFLRAAGILPGFAVSAYLGGLGIGYFSFISGSLAGAAPGLVCATFFGKSAGEPGRAGFWISGASALCVALASRALSAYAEKRK